jgi:hypothetical protein
MTDPNRACVGCGDSLLSGAATREHILPEWLAAKVHQPDLSLNHYLHDEDAPADELIRSHDLGSYVTKNVCSSCNSGWMSRLETQAQSLVLDLMHMQKSLLQLSNAERATLSAWAIKTAFMIATPQRTITSLPWHLFRTLAKEAQEHTTCECAVLAAQLQFLPKGFLYASPADLSPASQQPVQVRVGFSIDHLHFVVVIPILEGPRAIMATGIHIPLWPLDLEIRVRYTPFPTLTSTKDLINGLTHLVQAGLIRGPEELPLPVR